MYIIKTITGQEHACETFVAMVNEFDLYYKADNEIPDLTLAVELIDDIKIILD